MKTLVRLVAVALLAIMLYPLSAQAQGVRNNTCRTTSVTSASVPVSVIPPGSMTTYIIHPRSGAAVSILIFPYLTTLPGSIPANCASGTGNAGCMEVAINAYFADKVSCPSPECLDGVGNGWAAVLSTGVTAVTTDSCWR